MGSLLKDDFGGHGSGDERSSVAPVMDKVMVLIISPVKSFLHGEVPHGLWRAYCLPVVHYSVDVNYMEMVIMRLSLGCSNVYLQDPCWLWWRKNNVLSLVVQKQKWISNRGPSYGREQWL